MNKQRMFFLFKRLFFTLFFCTMFSTTCPLFPVPCTLTYAAVPHLLNYQGKLTDSTGIPLNGSYAITFRIYDAETAGTLLWEEVQSGVVITKGVFSTLLGSVTALNLAFDKPYFLEIKVGSEVMSPRQRIASAAYAMRAEHGVPRGVIVMWSGKIADVPSGWSLCDGTNGTPDLRDRFIVGVRQDDAGVAKTSITGSLTQVGGSTTITEANLPSHTHGVGTLSVSSNGAHTHNLSYVISGENMVSSISIGGGGSIESSSGFIDSQGSHTHSLSGLTGSKGSGTAYTQPYYALAFIMKL